MFQNRKPINLAGAIQIPKMDSKGHITDVLKDFDSITESGNTSQQTADGNEGINQQQIHCIIIIL